LSWVDFFTMPTPTEVEYRRVTYSWSSGVSQDKTTVDVSQKGGKRFPNAKERHPGPFHCLRDLIVITVKNMGEAAELCILEHF